MLFFVNEGDTKIYVCISVSYAAACHNHLVFETWVGERKAHSPQRTQSTQQQNPNTQNPKQSLRRAGVGLSITPAGR